MTFYPTLFGHFEWRVDTRRPRGTRVRPVVPASR